MPNQCLVIVDADRIHDYVFSPHHLKLIRGGSNIERQLNEVQMLRLLPGDGNVDRTDPERPAINDTVFPACKWEAIFAGGGTALVEFADRPAAEEYCRNVERAFLEKTATATVSWAIQDCGASFRDTLDKAQAALALRKEGKTEPLFNGSSPYWKACEDCGRHPVTVQYTDPDSRTRLCCEACQLRRKAGERGDYLDLIAALAGTKLHHLKDLSQLGALSRPENYLAMVYIDLDRLGRYLHTHGKSKEEYRTRSGQIRDAVNKGILEACAAICPRTDERAAPPFEILLIGGDDAILFVAADRVFDFLDEFARSFHQSIATLPDQSDLSFSAGIVWAHHHFPIAQFRARAEDLVRSAKTKDGDAVDWSVVSEAGFEKLTTARINARRGDVSSTQKPYLFEDFRKLAGAVRDWKQAGVPSTKVKALYPIAHQKQHQSTLAYWCLYNRLTPKHQGLFDAVFPGGPWQGQPAKSTKAADLVELWDFISTERP